MDSDFSEYCLRWKKYETNFRSYFSDLYQNDALVDVSLVTQEGNFTSAHRVVLSACSPYFQNLFKNIPFNHPHPVIVLKDVCEADLQAILSFMYKGYVNVTQSRVNGIIAIASSLQVKGLSSAPNSQENQGSDAGTSNSGNGPTPTQIPPLQDYTRPLPNLRPSPDSLRVGQKRKLEAQSAESNGAGKESEYFGKPPPLHSHLPQPKMASASYTIAEGPNNENIEIKLENLDSSYSTNDGSHLDESKFMEDEAGAADDGSRDMEGDEDQFHSSSKTLDSLDHHNLEGVGFVDDSDYSEALEFVQQDAQFLGEPSSSAGTHFMTATNSSVDVKPVNKKKGSSSETRRFKCNTCGNQYNKYSHLNRHLQTHADPRFQCDKCLKLFVRKDVLRRHLIEVHNVVVQNCKIK